MGLTNEQLELYKILRMMSKEPEEAYDGTKKQAIRLADEFTQKYGLKAMVIRKKGKYDWVTEAYFTTYPYSGKIYHETNPTDILESEMKAVKEEVEAALEKFTKDA